MLLKVARLISESLFGGSVGVIVCSILQFITFLFFVAISSQTKNFSVLYYLLSIVYVLILVGIIIGGVALGDKIAEKKVNRQKKRKPSITKELYKGLKERFCSRIEYEN